VQLVTNAPTSNSELLDQASAWVTRLSSDCVDENDLQAFSFWITQGEGHKAAFDEVLDLWQDLGVVKHLPIDIPKTSNTEKSVEKSSNLKSWGAFSAIAASLIVAAIVLPLTNNSPDPEFFSTEVGQRQTVQLDDGSSVILNTNTRLDVVLTKNQRNINLHSGEAFFEVAKDPERPFVVNSCASEVRAIGTAFNVRCNREKGIVTVTEGAVQVTDTSPNHAQKAPALLKKDQSLIVDNKHGISIPITVDSRRFVSWRQGQLIFENTSLAEVLEEANRYSKTQISLGAPQMAHLQVTGRFDSTDTQTLLAAIKHSLSLESVDQNNNMIILKKN
jgi:transmembrane sensor